MTESEIGGLILSIFLIGTWVAWVVYIIILAYKSNHEGKKSKKERIKELEKKVKVLEFKVENPNGLQLRLVAFWGVWELDYISCDTVKTISLPSATEYKFVRGYIVDNEGNKYKFDVDNEILIKIEKK